MGEVFAGRYELVDPIGRGGVGAVWRAWDHRRRRYVAAKVLQQRDAHSLLRFVREQALRIDHPHVLAPASWAADDDQVLFTMDLVTGGSLVHLVGDYGPLPPGFVCVLLDQLLAGLTAVHAEDVVHRDVKPANVLLEATGTGRPRLRLSDFGIAMRLGEPRLTETNLVVGTPGYLAPEQMMGAEPDFPADLFAVGLVALYLLEGARPDAKALVRYFAEHGTPPAPRGVPEPLWQVLATLLQPDPVARFRTATGARKALAAAVELLPEPGPDDEIIEIFDQLGPLPPGFGPDGPLKRASGVSDATTDPRRPSGPTPPGTPPAPVVPPSDPAGSPPAPTGAPPIPDSSSSAPTGAPPIPDAPAPVGAPRPPDGASPAPVAAPPRPDASPPPPVGAPPAPEGSAPPIVGAPHPDASPRSPEERPAGPVPEPPRPSGMSDTGSFPLPPPQPSAAVAPTPASPQPYVHAPAYPRPPEFPAPGHRPPHAAPFPARSPRPSRPADVTTAAYTAQAAPAAPPAPAHPQHRRRRPGPPAGVTIPVLLLALACYAVGFWALTRV
ncbi:protein kinase [Streptomyces sp. NPDC047725]|uniref:protein kinase domain-containing protein n=1 Tax=Streptomyces sp. NPDC047725 TaxID=3365487 RepID=UPI0037176500